MREEFRDSSADGRRADLEGRTGVPPRRQSRRIETRRRAARVSLIRAVGVLVFLAVVMTALAVTLSRGGVGGVATSSTTGGTLERVAGEDRDALEPDAAPATSRGSPATSLSTIITQKTTTTSGIEPGDVRVPGTHYGPINTEFAGVTMFRGNGSRTYYGEGPVPTNPKVLWKFGPMEGASTYHGQPFTWTGTGWTGQPAVIERPDGTTWVIFGSYDKYIHFLDAETGKKVYPSFKGGNIFKGSVTVDPDGYPLVFMGCRDNEWKVIAIDREEPVQLWHMHAADVQIVWNDDWDGNVVIRNDYAFVPGENSHFFIVKLNRGYDAEGKVTVSPRIVLDFPSWTDALFEAIGDQETSIENSPALVGDRVYFANSGGLIHGLDVSATLRELEPGEDPPQGRDAFPVVFRWWDGDDTDASIVVDDEGFLYVGVELQRFLPRAKEVGQIIKVDPTKNAAGDNPLVWSVEVTKLAEEGLSGVWATPCLYRDMVYVPTHSGALLGIDRFTGNIRWRKPFTTHAWSSAVVVDGVLIVADNLGVIHAYDVTDTKVDPPEVWAIRIPTGGAFESTPVVWKGRIYVGCRDGFFYCLGDE
ncbi:MAG: PQQ-like beta-propeller repeat protein [Actinobacteria bacterium]|nr:PQQ-like beta-propeller repeat protein [Actinomycetota bacterium]